MCCLRPGIPGVSHNIQVRSIIGRLLEHSRVFYFLNSDAEEQLLLSSADWMERNLDKRIETCFPLEGKKLVSRVKKELLTYLSDNTHAWLLHSDGSYQHLQPNAEQEECNAQARFLEKLSIPLINVL